MPNCVNFWIFKVRDIISVSYLHDPSAKSLIVKYVNDSAFTQLEVGRSMLEQRPALSNFSESMGYSGPRGCRI